MTSNINRKKQRRDYRLKTEEVQELTRASHSIKDKEMAVEMTKKVWGRIADRLNIHINTIKDSIDPQHKGDPRWFSAIPIEKVSEEE